MQGRSKQKNWSISALKRRGWTPELIKALLPEPQLVYRPNAKGKMRVWAKADVLAAEATAEFASGRAESSAAGQHQAAGLLKAAWDAAGHDPGTAGRLAGHYHGAIIKLLGAGRQKPLGARQAVSRMAEFLALSRRCDTARVPEIMKNFVRAAAWLGRDECGETGRRVLAEYPAVLEAAAGRVLGDFCAAAIPKEIFYRVHGNVNAVGLVYRRAENSFDMKFFRAETQDGRIVNVLPVE